MLFYSNQIEHLRNELKFVSIQQSQQIDDIKNSLCPLIETMNRELIQAITIQKEENKKQQISITGIKKEAYQVQLGIEEADRKASFLEDSVGDYKAGRAVEWVFYAKRFKKNRAEGGGLIGVLGNLWITYIYLFLIIFFLYKLYRI